MFNGKNGNDFDKHLDFHCQLPMFMSVFGLSPPVFTGHTPLLMAQMINHWHFAGRSFLGGSLGCQATLATGATVAASL